MDINNKSPKQALLISPLLGGLFSLLVFIVYFFILIFTNTTNASSADVWFNAAWNLFTYLPIIAFILISISYIFSATIGIALFKLKQYYFLSSGVFWFLAWILGTVVGLIFGGFNYYLENNVAKFCVIVFCFSLSAVFNASLFSVLTGDIADKYKLKNEK